MVQTASDYTDILPFTDLVPAIPIYVQLTVTAVFTVLYSIIFIACYIQLWLLLCLGYSRRLHPFGLLWLALIWSGLRILLFSYYWPYFGVLTPGSITPNMHHGNDSHSILSPILAYFLYAFPSCLQFFMLCFVVSFAVGIYAREFTEPSRTVLRIRGFLVTMCLIFIFASVVAVTLQVTIYNKSATPLWLTATRVLIQDTLFLLLSVFLVVCLRRVAALPHVSLILESLNTNGRCGLLFTGLFLVITFITRALYDVTALSLRSLPSFDFGWIDLSDHAEVSKVLGPNAAYAVFAGVLLVWDLLPTAVVLFLFRLRRPQFIRAPGATNVLPFWGADNFDDSMHEDWTFRINESPEDGEALLGNDERFTSTPTFPIQDATTNGTVRFGVGSDG